MSKYEAQHWDSYDNNKDFATNVAEGRVATGDRMNHMEQGIATANEPYIVGSVTVDEDGKANVTINEDKSVDFVVPRGPAGAAGADGINGTDGKSAYELWRDLEGNENSTELDFLNSLKGEQGDQGEPGQDGADGAAGPAGADGADGQSAYELWKAQDGNADKTEEDFLNSLKGEKGEKGDPGQDGAEGATGPAGEDGKSAFEVWKELEGNADKTEEDFFESLKGEQGEPGQSAYELWKLQDGNENKTEEDFLNSLKNNDGGINIMTIGHGTLDEVSSIGEGTNDVKITVKYTDPAEEGVPYGGTVIAVKEDSAPTSPDDADIVASNDCMYKDKYKSTALEIPIANNKGPTRNFFVRMFPYSADRVFNLLGRETKSIELTFNDMTKNLTAISTKNDLSNSTDQSLYRAGLDSDAVVTSKGTLFMSGPNLYKRDGDEVTAYPLTDLYSQVPNGSKVSNPYNEGNVIVEHNGNVYITLVCESTTTDNRIAAVFTFDGTLFTYVSSVDIDTDDKEMDSSFIQLGSDLYLHAVSGAYTKYIYLVNGSSLDRKLNLSVGIFHKICSIDENNAIGVQGNSGKIWVYKITKEANGNISTQELLQSTLSIYPSINNMCLIKYSDEICRLYVAIHNVGIYLYEINITNNTISKDGVLCYDHDYTASGAYLSSPERLCEENGKLIFYYSCYKSGQGNNYPTYYDEFNLTITP